MPSGRRSLFSWFMQHELTAGAVARRGLVVVSPGCGKPVLKRVRGRSRPIGRRRFPDALTVFGWPCFSRPGSTQTLRRRLTMWLVWSLLPSPAMQPASANCALAIWCSGVVGKPCTQHALVGPATSLACAQWLARPADEGRARAPTLVDGVPGTGYRGSDRLQTCSRRGERHRPFLLSVGPACIRGSHRRRRRGLVDLANFACAT